MNFFLQISPDQAIDITTKVTPLTTFGYGFAVLVLAILAYSFYKRAMRAEEINEKQASQMLEFGMQMSGQLAANQQLMAMLQQNPEDTKAILILVKQNNEKLESLKGEFLSKKTTATHESTKRDAKENGGV